MPFNLSMTHLMVVGVVALMVLGPERLPGVAKTVGSFYREYKRIRGDVEGEIREAINEFKEPFREHIDTVKGVVNDFRDEAGLGASTMAPASAVRPSGPPLDLPLLPGARSDHPSDPYDPWSCPPWARTPGWDRPARRSRSLICRRSGRRRPPACSFPGRPTSGPDGYPGRPSLTCPDRPQWDTLDCVGRTMVTDIFGMDGVVVLVVVLAVLFGSSRIPKLARSLGSAQKEFKQGLEEGRAKGDDDADKGPPPA